MKKAQTRPAGIPLCISNAPSPIGLYRELRQSIEGDTSEDFFSQLREGHIGHFGAITDAYDLDLPIAHPAQLRVPAGSLLITDIYASQSDWQKALTNTIQPAMERRQLPNPMPLTGELLGCLTGAEADALNTTQDLFAAVLFWPQRQGLNPYQYLDVMERTVLAESPPQGLGIHLAYAFRSQAQAPSVALLAMEVWYDQHFQHTFLTERLMPAMRELGVPRPRSMPLIPLGMGASAFNYLFLTHSA